MNIATVSPHVRITKHVNNESPINVKKSRTHKEIFNNLLDKLSIHYDIDMHKLVKLCQQFRERIISSPFMPPIRLG